MNVLSIQSHVVYGRVGNRSAVFPLERMGIEVWPVNTVQYSTNTGLPGWTGTAFGAGHVREIVAGLDRLGILARCDAVLSGYVADAATGRAILDAVARVRAANPRAVFCCDPVMGDLPGGLYVNAALPGFFAAEALPAADIVIPNLFEAASLSGLGLSGPDDAARAADAIHALGPRIVIMTSCDYGPGGTTGFLLSEDGARHALRTPVLPFPRPVKGAGDLFGSLFLGNYLKLGAAVPALESAASSLFAVLEATLASGCAELALLDAQDAIAAPPARFRAVPA